MIDFVNVEHVNQPTSISWVQSRDGYIKANAGQYGYYRVMYPESNWAALSQALLTAGQNQLDFPLSSVDRAGLINDAFSLARAGLLNYTTALDLTRFLVYERDYVVWTAAFDAFRFIQNRLIYEPIYGKFAAYVRSLFDSGYMTR